MTGWKRWLPLLLAIPFLALLAFGLTRDPRTLASPLPGESAPDFALRTLDGDTLRLADLRGRVVVLNFWASWCIPCREEHPALLRADRVYPRSEAVVVGVLYQDSPEAARRFLASLGGDWPTVLDPGTRTAIDFGVYGVPETFFIGRDGTIARKHIGPVNWELVRSTVDSLLAARDEAAVRPAPAPGGEAAVPVHPAPGGKATGDEG